MKGFRLQIIGYSLIFFLLSAVTCTLYPILAADSTPSADPLRQSDSEASIKAKLEELKKEIASKAAKLKQVVNKKLKDKSYIGKVKHVSLTSLTLATKNGPKLVNINQDSEFNSNISGKKYSQKNISEEDYLATLGDVDETGVLTARKIILLPTSNKEPKIYLWGQIISSSDKLVTLKDPKSKSITVSLPNSSKVSTLDFVILTGSFGKNDIFEADFVYVIPQGGIIKPKKMATPSAQVSTPSSKIASPSARPPAKPASR